MELTSFVSPHSYDGVNLGEDHLALPKRVTVTEEGRSWFGRGWFHVVNYNHEEAVSCFMRCLEVDPACMMAYWGIAYALSSNYNFDVGLGCGYDSIQAALAGIKADEASYSEFEKDLIMALTFRSTEAARAAVDPAKLNLGNSMELNMRFADEMAKLYAKYPDDVDVIAVYAEATMVLKPWALWRKDDVSGEIIPADDNTIKVQEALARAMKLPGGMEHPAILHLICHMMELSSEPQAADEAANALRKLFPAAGHLTHMASHIDIWAGRYKEALDSNVAAIKADNLTVNFMGVEDNFYKAYRIHNFHMVVWAAMFTGEQSVAMHYARELDGLLLPGDDVSGLGYKLFGCIPFGALFLEPYTLTKWHAMVRFGLWDVILAEPLYEDSSMYATGLASGYYARGIAFASKGLIAEAEAEQAKYHDAMKNPALEGRMVHNNLVISEDAPSLLKVGESMLAGEIEYRKGNAELAFEHMREAVRRDMGLLYDEPWGWMVPAEHALGALLLEHGHVEEATSVFRSNLKMYEENMWGLLGLYQCLEKAGDPAAVDVKRRFDVAAERSEVKPVATCFCAQASGARPPDKCAKPAGVEEASD